MGAGYLTVKEIWIAGLHTHTKKDAFLLHIRAEIRIILLILTELC